MSTPSVVRVPGPLAEHAPGFEAHLVDRGYADRTVTSHFQAVVRLSRWLEKRRVAPEDLDVQVIGRFVAGIDPRGRRRVSCSSFLLLDYLRATGTVPQPVPPALSPLDELLGVYRRWLVEERSLASLTVQGYVKTAEWFCQETCAGERDRLATLEVSDVTGFVLRAARTRSPRTVNGIVVNLRSWLKFLYAQGLISTPLAGATPWMARGTMATLPRTVPAGTGERLLKSCDRSKVAGQRDYAIIKVLARLGLRAAEVAALELGDIDWRAGQVMIRSKGGWRDPLPLPVDVGQAIVDYLKVRGPAADVRQVFLHVNAPSGPVRASTVRSVVHEACERCGLADVGTHRLRHGAASEMLAAGAPLYEIGQVLRHRDAKTTALYAKVDLTTLTTVAKAWPGSAR
jgi:site-specific recombinase XerD